MENTCKTCKHYYNKTCNNSSVNLIPEVTDNIHKIVEDGLLDEYIRENVKVDIITKQMVEMLEEAGYINKRKKELNFKKLDEYCDVENTIIELCSEAVFTFMLKQMDNRRIEIGVKIEYPDEFGCIHWE